MIKIIGDEIPAPTSTGAGTSVGNATMVRCFNSGGTDRLITVQLADNTRIGRFTLRQYTVEYLDKNITDEIYGSTATALFSSVIVMG